MLAQPWAPGPPMLFSLLPHQTPSLECSGGVVKVHLEGVILNSDVEISKQTNFRLRFDNLY